VRIHLAPQVRFIDVKACSVTCEVAALEPMQKGGCSCTVDARGNHLAVVTDGKVRHAGARLQTRPFVFVGV
jgi:acyl-coenzyme A thioesterase PaaI-like protein